MQNLFVYGSLLFSEMLEALTGKIFKTEDAILKDFKRFSVLGEDYPAIEKTPNSKVAGKLIFEMDEHSLSIITFYEGDQYELRKVQVECQNKSIEAYVFCWKQGLEYLDDKEWDMEKFRSESLSFYINEVAPETQKAFEQDQNNLF